MIPEIYIVTQEGVITMDNVIFVDERQIAGYNEGDLVVLTRFGLKGDDLVTVYYKTEAGYVQYRGNNLNTIVCSDEEQAETAYDGLIRITALVKACMKVKENEEED